MGKKYLKKDLIVVGILAIIVFLLNIRHIAILNGPYMFNDEFGYLGNAAAFAGKDWHEVMQHCLWYGYGWSILLVPLFLMFSKMQIIYRCVNVINAVIVVSFFLMVRHLLQKKFNGLSNCLITTVSLGTCFYPSILVNSSMAWSETWLLFVFTGCTLFLYYMIQNPRTYKAVVFGILLYYLYVCHNRMIPVVIAGILVFVALGLTGSYKKLDILLFFGALVLSGMISGFIKAWLVATSWQGEVPSKNDIQTVLNCLPILATADGRKNFIGVLLGQFLYSCVASCGIAQIGLYASACKIISTVKQHKIKESLFEIWLVLSFFGVLATSAIFSGIASDFLNVDIVLFGRYLDIMIIILVPYGFLYLAKLKEENTNNFAIYKTWYVCIVGICTLAACLVIRQLNNAGYNLPCIAGMAVFFEQFSEPSYTAPAFASALISIIGTILIVELFNHKNILKYAAICCFTLFCFINAHSAERSITENQKYYNSEIPLINAVSDYDFEDLPVYLLCDQPSPTDISYFQSMVPNILLKYSENLSLESVPEEKYYTIISRQNYLEQWFDVHNEVLVENKNHLFLYVDKTIKNTNRLSIPLETMCLKDISSFETGYIHVRPSDGELAFFGPYIGLEGGNYILEISLSVESTKELKSYGKLQIYSNSQQIVFDEMEITKEYINTGTRTIYVPFSLEIDINDIEFYLQTSPDTSYDIYDIKLEREYVYSYMLNTGELWFETDGFSYVESEGRWMDENEASITCYLPPDDYLLTLELGYPIPLDQIGLNEYFANVYINDFYLGDIMLKLDNRDGLYQFEIAEKYMHYGHNTIIIKCEQLWSPSVYGSSDSRNLGVCIKDILFTPMS